MTQLNRMPDYNQPLVTKGVMAAGWARFFQGLWTGTPTANVSVVTVNANPFTYTAPAGGTAIVNGGTVTSVKFSRDGANLFVTGQTQGCFPVSQGDQLIIAYSVGPPTVTFVPR